MVTLFSNPISNWPIDHIDLSMANCIKQSIQTYPFSAEKHAYLINLINPVLDFSFSGNMQLINGVFYCLIKNAMHSIYSSENSEIIIALAKSSTQNIVYFKFNEVDKTNNLLSQYKLFALGTPEKPENGYYFIKNVLKKMNGDVEFKRIKNGSFMISLLLE